MNNTTRVSASINGAAKATIGLMIVTMLSKVLGFVRELVLASVYGASSYTDAYLIALNIPTVIFTAIGTALSTTFIPMYFECKKSGGDGEALKYTNNIVNIISILSVVISIICLIYIEPLVKVFAMGFDGEKLKLTIDFTRIMILSLLFISLSELMKSFLNANKNFSIPGIMMGIPSNIIIIISILLSAKMNPYLIAVGTLVGMASKFVFQLPYAYKLGYRYKFNIQFNDKYLKRTILLVGPVFIGVAVNQMNSMIDRTLASTLSSGSVSALNYANKLNDFVLGLFIASISVVIFPMLSKLSIGENNDEFIDCMTKSINSVILLVMPISIGAIVLSKPIVTILFERGAFDKIATNMTSSALVFYSIGLVAFSLREIMSKVFYSLQDTRTPMINGSISMIMNIVLNIVLVKYMGHAGLAFATSISGIICVGLLFTCLKKRIGYFGEDKIMKVAIKSLISSLLMGAFVYLTYKWLITMLGLSTLSYLVALIGSILSGVIIYGVLIYILKIDEVNFILDGVKNKLSK